MTAVLRTKLTFVKATFAAENALRSGPGWLKFALPADWDMGSIFMQLATAMYICCMTNIAACKMVSASVTRCSCTPTWQRWEEAVVVAGATLAARGVVHKSTVRARQAAVSVGIDRTTAAARRIVDKCSVVQVQHAVLHPDHAACMCQHRRHAPAAHLQLRWLQLNPVQTRLDFGGESGALWR